VKLGPQADCYGHGVLSIETDTYTGTHVAKHNVNIAPVYALN